MKKKHSLPVRCLRAVGVVLLCVVVLLAGLVGFLSLTEYRPDARETLDVRGRASAALQAGTSFTVASWNIGYGALGDNADFFMDGGSMVKTADSARIEQNLDGILAEIDALQPDILFLQEVDVCSSRSEKIDESARVADRLNGFCMSFANNFKVAFLPYPFPPIGKVDSGLATYSSFDVSAAERVQLPIPFSWPMRMANLKRCLLVSRVPITDSNRELVLFNLHLEAYDDGEGKREQTKMLADLLAEESAKGNYVIAGGDFNQIFSTADGSAFPVQTGNWAAPEIDASQFDGRWQFLMDESVPSCRSLYRTYAGADKTDFQYYLIDGFIVSDNLTVDSFAAQDLGFAVSDHNPLLLRVTMQE
jgi:endonuclease/exonuclease/phosphatase family metal-dependent hydrolase